VNSPKKRNQQNKRKEAPKQMYRRVEPAPLLLTAAGENPGTSSENLHDLADASGTGNGSDFERIPKKKRPTPDNSAEDASQPCPSQ
jgi:hypothetical protein